MKKNYLEKLKEKRVRQEAAQHIIDRSLKTLTVPEQRRVVEYAYRLCLRNSTGLSQVVRDLTGGVEAQGYLHKFCRAYRDGKLGGPPDLAYFDLLPRASGKHRTSKSQQRDAVHVLFRARPSTPEQALAIASEVLPEAEVKLLTISRWVRKYLRGQLGDLFYPAPASWPFAMVGGSGPSVGLRKKWTADFKRRFVQEQHALTNSSEYHRKKAMTTYLSGHYVAVKDLEKWQKEYPKLSLVTDPSPPSKRKAKKYLQAKRKAKGSEPKGVRARRIPATPVEEQAIEAFLAQLPIVSTEKKEFALKGKIPVPGGHFVCLNAFPFNRFHVADAFRKLQGERLRMYFDDDKQSGVYGWKIAEGASLATAPPTPTSPPRATAADPITGPFSAMTQLRTDLVKQLDKTFAKSRKKLEAVASAVPTEPLRKDRMAILYALWGAHHEWGASQLSQASPGGGISEEEAQAFLDYVDKVSRKNTASDELVKLQERVEQDYTEVLAMIDDCFEQQSAALEALVGKKS